MPTAPTDRRQDLDRVRERRNALRVTLDTLEAANASPAEGRWRERMIAALDQADATLRAHVEQTEGPGGFFEELTRHEPRVARQVALLEDEHVQIQRALNSLLERCAQGSCSATETRRDVEHLMGLLHRHRHAGADLVYEAYKVDVAFGD